MKKLIVLFIAIILNSCSYHPQDLCNYQDLQIVDKGKQKSDKWLKFREKGKITEKRYFTDFDWYRFSIGDTVKCEK